jgi:hypothetical protein
MSFYVGFPIVGDLELTVDYRDIALSAGPGKVLQSIQTRALIFKGSWRYDRNLGVPYFQEILLTGTPEELVRRRFHELIAETDGVTAVQFVRLRFDTESATMYVDFSCTAENETVSGTLDFAVAA